MTEQKLHNETDPKKIADFLRNMAKAVENGRVKNPHIGFYAEQAAVVNQFGQVIDSKPTGNSTVFLHCRFEK